MPKKQKPLCKFYQSAKGCKFGSACKFRHEEINSKPHQAEHHFTGIAVENDEEPDVESFMKNSFAQGAPPFPLFLQMMMNSMKLDDQDDEFSDEDEFGEEFDDEDDFEDEFEDDDVFPGSNSSSFHPRNHQDAIRFLLSQMNHEDTSDEEEEESIPSSKSLPLREDTTIVEEEDEIFSLQAKPPFCATCGKPFPSKEDAKQHMIDSGHWFCPQCGMNFKSSVLYLAHRDARHLSAESQEYIIYLQKDSFAETFKSAHPIQNNLCMRLLCNIYLNYGLPLWKETNVQATIKKIIDQIFLHELTLRAIREQPFPLPHYLEFSDMMFNPSSPFKANQEYKILHKQCQEHFSNVFKQYIHQSTSKESILKMTRMERTRFVSSNYFQAWIYHPNLSQWSKNTNDAIQVNLDIVLGWDVDAIAAQKLSVPRNTSPKLELKTPATSNHNNETAKVTSPGWYGLDDPQVAKKSARSPTKLPPNENTSTSAPTQPKAAFNFTNPPGFSNATQPPAPGKPFTFIPEPSAKPNVTPTPTPSSAAAPPTKPQNHTPPATKTSIPVPSKPADELGPCLSCGKPASSRCSRCKTACYCGTACQKAHWGTHKKTCGSADTNKKSNSNSAPKTAELIWYANMDKKGIYQRFIDSYRLRVDDDYVWGSNIHGLYASEDPLPDFKKFLNKAKQANVMPAWWKAENDQDLIEMATNDDWANINYAVEKSDIIDHYGFGEHLILRMLGQQICGDF